MVMVMVVVTRLTCKAFKCSQQFVALSLDQGQTALQGSRLIPVALSPVL